MPRAAEVADEPALVEKDASAAAALELDVFGPWLGPFQNGAVGVGGIGRGEDDDAVVGIFGGIRFTAQHLIRAGRGELSAAHAGDEIAAAHAAGLLHRAEDWIKGGESPFHDFAVDCRADEHAVAAQELFG